MSQEGEWAKVVLGDSEDSPSGWVDADYIAIDPSWYRTNGETPVYAWDDTSAPKVALLDDGTTLPILRDDGNWIVVSLRGATGWINNPDRNASQNTNGSDSGTAQSNSGSAAGESSQGTDQSSWFTVYARDGETVSIHSVGGAMYEDQRGRTYVKQENDGYYYCITTDITYAFDPGVWTGEVYGENEFPGEAYDEYDADLDGDGLPGSYYGENPDWTGEDYGENSTLTGEDYGENGN